MDHALDTLGMEYELVTRAVDAMFLKHLNTWDNGLPKDWC